MSIETLTLFICYMTFINLFLYVLCIVLFRHFRKPMLKLQVRILRLSDKYQKELEQMFLHWLVRYETLIFFFNIIPLIALKLMA